MAQLRRPRFYPPIYFLFALIGILILHYFFPVGRWLDWPWRAIGIVILATGFTLGLVAAGEFRRRETTITPFEQSRTLITDGPYRFTRNPLYLSMTLMLIGLALTLGTLSPLIVTPVFVWWITTRFIVLEERHLDEQFGSRYAAYKSQVRRWL
ncbi:MAG TPA: isoprenylcysteine carboxylmethyltransferase family protein [bacterium]|jgi:protein-S-isoprenylcysteine O-methyltransferase Ste14|nr:isoprenylcysteine carboxylmethyltransferase family protein [bacterium]